MKKALLKVLVLCIIICSAFCVFTACTESPISFKVNFVVDEEIVKTIDTAGNEKISLPENPKKDGYDFDGWFWDKDVWEKPFTANSLLDAPLSSDMSVYAKFTIKHEHNYTAIITAPTCTERGYTSYTCDCGDSYIDDYVDELGHDFGAWTETTAPNCNTKGVETRYCSRNNTHKEIRETDKLQHEFTNYVSDNNATYDSDGTKTAHCNHGCGATDTIPDVGTKLQSGIAFKTLAVDGNNVYGKIPNTQTEFDFLTEIETKGNVTFKVSRNLAGDDIIVSKTAEPNIGNNKYYILVYQNGELLSRYNVTIRRREIYDVTFNANGGTAVDPQRIEEDNFATEPTTTRAGYTFTEWDYIFGNPITSNTVITAGWVANTDTKYKAEYYLQNLADDNYTLDFTDNLTGETDKQATAEIKTYNHYTFNESKSIVSGNINGDETTVLKVYYTRDIYGFTVTNENTKGGAIVCTDNGNYRFGKQINLSATVNNGYDFVGWYKGDTQVSGEIKYSFTLTENTDITAKYSAHKNTKYTVETYLENLDGTYTKQNTEEKFGETDTAAIITYIPEHYTVNESKSVLSGNINGDGSLMLTIYYARELYKVSVTADMGITSNTVKGDYKYGSIIDDITATLNLGYNWQGWYSDNEFMTNEFIISSFIVDKNINYIAKTTTKYEMLAFNFVSTPMTCEVTGIKDDTVNGIVIPDYVTSIGNCAFTHCGNLTSVTIGCGVTSIGYEAFWYCYGLTSIVIPNSIFSIGDRAFFGCEKLVEIINKSDLDIQKSSSDYGYIGYYALTVHNGESKIVNKDGYLFIADSENNYLLGFIGTETALTLPSDYNRQNYQIYKYAFYNCTNLTSVTIPNSITIIEDYAFYNCSGLTSITLPTSLAKINSYSFENCSHLTSVFYDGDIAGWCNISFNNSYANPLFYANILFIKGNDGYKLVDNLVIPEVVTKIGSYAFINCTSLTQIFIPESVTSIGDNAFYKCSPKKVYYMGTASEWKNIEIGKSNNLFPRYYYSETEQEGCWHYVNGEIVEWPIYGY